jgi:hypothetical protein
LFGKTVREAPYGKERYQEQQREQQPHCPREKDVGQEQEQQGDDHLTARNCQAPAMRAPLAIAASVSINAGDSSVPNFIASQILDTAMTKLKIRKVFLCDRNNRRSAFFVAVALAGPVKRIRQTVEPGRIPPSHNSKRKWKNAICSLRRVRKIQGV